MQFPSWIKPAVIVAGVGANALTIVGFSWGGWVTRGTAESLASSRAATAVVAALTPYCLDRARNDPQSVDVLAQLEAATTYSRRGIIEAAGWATPLGSEEPNTALAQACQLALSEEA